MVCTDNNPLTYQQSKSKLEAVEQRWSAELASFNFKIEYRAGKHNTNTDPLSRIRWANTEGEDAGTDAEERTTHVAGMLTTIAETTKVPEEVQLRLLGDAIRVEELGVTRPADECAEQATFLSFTPRDRIAEFQQKDAAVARLKHYLGLGRKPYRGERKQETREPL